MSDVVTVRGGATIADSAELRADVRTFLDRGLMLGPWLAGLEQERFSFDSQELLAEAAEGLAAAYWQEPLITATIGDVPATTTLGRRGVREILDSTAATIASGRLGRIRVDRAIAQEAVRRMEAFITAAGFGALIRVYLLVVTAKNHGALRYYKEIPEDEFIRCVRHRPWMRESIEPELMRDIALREMRLVVRNGRRFVTDTARGRRSYEEARRILEETGFVRERLELLRASSYSALENYDEVIFSTVPLERSWRRGFNDFMGLRAGQSVLDVGCGPASQAFEGGALAAVGPSGHLTGLDPAVGMLERARAKASGNPAASFVQGVAEQLPFADASFDVTLDVSALQMTDIDRAIAEMVRVTRPGGRVAHAGAYRVPGPTPAWVLRWLAPVIEIARRYRLPPAGLPPEAGEMARRLAAAGLRNVRVAVQENTAAFADLEQITRYLLSSELAFYQVLEIIPFAARRELHTELVRRGREIAAETDLAERTLPTPTEYVCGEVPGGPA